MPTKMYQLWLPLAYVILLPLVSPFGIGIQAGTTSGSTPNQFSPSLKRVSLPPSTLTNRNIRSMATTNLQVTDTTENQIQEEIPPLEKIHNPVWRLGSALLYTYVDPLLRTASERPLDETDVFPSPAIVKMEHQVPQLETIYAHCRTQAEEQNLRYSMTSPRKNKSSFQSRWHPTISKSESLVLAKALCWHMKTDIWRTGLLRLVNTSIQAFPAILVARLLRLIEAGDSIPSSQAIRAALYLVAVLSLKMIVENQYFHSVVKCSTMVRGSLSGMIFDKSLKVAADAGYETAEKEDGKKKERGDEKKKDFKKDVDSSSVLNLVQSDVSIIENASLQIHTIWDGLLQMFIYSTLLYKYLGKSVFWGIAVLVLTIPTNALCLRVLNRLGKLELQAKDIRTKKTNEAITNMKLLKLQAWEHHFKKGIEDARKEELMRHMNRGAFRAFNQAISNAVPSIVLVVTLTAYMKTGRPIVASTIFTAISLFNQLRFPLLFYPLVIDSFANAKNSLRRLSSYLCQEDLTTYVQNYPKDMEEGGAITMTNGNFLWSKPSSRIDGDTDAIAAPALCSAEIAIHGGEIVAVVGNVGSGKTALVKALLGELEPVPKIMVNGQTADTTNGASIDIASVVAKGEVAYCPQEAWLSKGSIRDSILFGRDYDERRYLNAIYDAGLDDDMRSGTLTDDTDVGEGGSSLSGGQRARVQLARALYEENSGVYLLDDPLSALDAAVGATVFDRITKRMRERRAAVVLVTNDVSLPRRCDRVILMSKAGNGSSGNSACSQIEDIGTYDELISRGHDLNSITIYKKSTESDEEVIDSYENKDHHQSISHHSNTASNADMLVPHDEDSIEKHSLQDSPVSVVNFSNTTDNVKDLQKSEKKVQKTSTFKESSATMDDTMTKGAVPLSTYITYFKSVKSPALIAITLACYLMANGAQFFQQYTVAKWTELGKEAASAVGGKYLKSLVNAAGAVSLFLWLRSFLLMRVGMKASEFLHNRMLTSVFNSPMTFFDSTPSGQLLSRFGKELETVDRTVPDGIGSVLFCCLTIALSAAGLTGMMTPGMIVPIAMMTLFYTKIMTIFRPTARDLKRFEAKSRSPIYTQFGEALKGVETIRSFPNSSTRWSSNLRTLVDKNLGVIYSVKALDRWLSIRLESLGNVVVLTAAFASVVLTRLGRMKSGSAGYGLTQSLAITGLLTWAVRTLTDYETAMMSVLRINEITGLDSSETGLESIPGSIPQEKRKTGEAIDDLYNEQKKHLFSTPTNDNALVASGWPWQGSISFQNVSMRYAANADLALKNVNLEVPAGTTLGVVGRTGSGKSTLLVTLFRLVEIESGGSIFIDGVDIRSVSLQTLRESLSIIPQDPVLFQGTLIYNLDATGKASMDEAWKALETASPALYNEYRASPLGLNSLITEGGKNLSAGQRQLICLARALLRNSKILVLDEATSSVDPRTDAQIQETIRREFVNKGVSVITVAHRLDTVLGSDKIAVLGDGSLIEYGTPNELLKIGNGHLRRLVDADNKNKSKGANIQISAI